MTKVAVTGGSGKLGTQVIRDLIEHGFEVHNFDIARPAQPSPATFSRIDFTDFGQTVEAMRGIDQLHDGLDAVVHLAAIPGPTHAGNAYTFVNNLTSTFHVFSAARLAGIKQIVWASSETLLGYPFGSPPPYLPLDEEIPSTPEVDYALAKCLEEELAKQFCRKDPELTMIGLRFSNVVDDTDYPHFPGFDADPKERMWNLWSYIDSRDGAQAVRLSLGHHEPGLQIFVIANPDTVMLTPTSELIERMLPGVELRKEFAGNESVMSIERAKTVLGFKPQHGWRQQS